MTRTFLPALALLGALVGCSPPPGSADRELGFDAAPALMDLNAFALKSSRWDSPAIEVCWENSTPESAPFEVLTRDIVRATWERASALRFVGWGACTATSDVRIRWVDAGPAVWGGLGKNMSGMTLNHRFENWSPSCQTKAAECVQSIAVHEFGHAIGLAHEQNRLDTPDSCNDAPQGGSGDWLIGDWDLESVMNYCNPEWNGDGVLSDTDKQAAVLMYGPRLPIADFNDDELGDLVAGLPGDNAASGGALVMYGDTLDGTDSQLWSQDSAGILDDSEAGEGQGEAVATGDFNNDGFSDLVVGVPGESYETTPAAGAVNVIYGGPLGLTSSGNAKISTSAAGQAGDQLGASLAVGDFNRDGYDDLAIGTPGETAGSTEGAGSVYIVHGSATGLTTAGYQRWDQDSAGIEDLAEPDDNFGASLAAADFDADGYDDLAVGVPSEDLGTLVDAGLVHIIYGSTSSLGSDDAQLWHQDSAGIKGVSESDDRFASALTTGDFDNDGYSDLAVGVPGEDIGTIDSAGAVNVLYGSSTGVSATDQLWHQGSTGVTSAPEPDERFGFALSYGDFDDDGYYDLAIGAPGNDDWRGCVHILHGGTDGLDSSREQAWKQSSPGVAGVARPGNGFGTSLSLADYDGANGTDLLVGVPFETVDGVTEAGTVSVLFGSIGLGLTDAGNQSITWDAAGIGAPQAGDALGASVR